MTRAGTKIATLLFLGGIVAGCRPSFPSGEQLQLPTNKDSKLFGASIVRDSTMDNQNGLPVSGLILHGASLVRNEEDLRNCKLPNYVIFRGFLLGNGMAGRYWSQQAEQDPKLGLPVMDTWPSEALVLSVNSSQVVTNRRAVKIAHAKLSVDTNDFRRRFNP